MKFLRLFIPVLFVCLHLSAYAQNDSTKLNSIIERVKALEEGQPFEKIYLHFDKPYYAVADTMWFKAYVTMDQNIPSPLSKIIYVEVFNAGDSLINTFMLPLQNGVGYGNIPINSKNYKQGNYYIRSYTQWMLNFGEEYFFTKNIPIGEAIDKELITNIQYTHENVDKSIKSTAKIQFKDINKKNLANKTVNWSIYANGDLVNKGKGTTDANGVLSVSVSRKENELISKGQIVTSIVLNDKETANANFDLKQNISDIDLQFFPEGGQLLSGVPNQVGIKAVGTNGLGIDFKGSILNGDNVEVAVISPGYAGMGSFYISPEEGKSYTAKITFKDGTVKKYPIPKAATSGISLQATQINDIINVKIIASAAFLGAHKGEPLYIVAQNNKAVYYAASTALNTQLINVKITKKDIPGGILQLCLFNQAGVPVSERLVFVMPSKMIDFQVKTDLPAYKPRQKVKMNILANVNKLPLAGDFSISVVDEQKVPYNEDKETTILSSLLLTSDLAGYIENPNYYFNKTDDKKLMDLDKLMLTQGYRRFSYSELMAGKFPTVSFLPEQGITLSGTLRDQTGMPVKKGNLRLTVTGKPVSAEVLSNNLGFFKFENLNLPDSSQVVISARYNTNGANMMILMNGSPAPMAGKNKNIYDEVNNIDTTLSAYLNNSQKQYRFMRNLKEVEIKGAPAKKISHLDHSNLVGLGMADHVIDGSSLGSCVTALECLRDRLTGLVYIQEAEKFYISRNYNSGSRVPVQVFLNNIAIDARDIRNITPADIESVEIFLNDVLGTVDRAYGTKGVLVINTKKKATSTKISKQELLDMLPKKNIVTLNPQGYSKQREFYSPKYMPNAPVSASDLRTTIYWNPKVLTDAKGEFNLEFFNADGKGNYKVIIEGFDKDGNIGRSIYHYKVN